MTKKRTGEPWKTAAEYGRSLPMLSLNLLVRDVAKSLPFYTEVLGFGVLYFDEDFAALERAGTAIQLHADHCYDDTPWAPRLAETGRRGLGAEIRIMGVDPDLAERRAPRRGGTVIVPTSDTAHGWRDCIVEDPDGYTFAVGIPR